MNKQIVMSTLNCNVDNNLNINSATSDCIETGTSSYQYWQNYYYPYVIQPTYPVYITERSLDKGKQAYEVIKVLKDKKLVDIRTVKQFIELMDSLIQIL
ncbi:MAG: hypothetical protein Q8L27_01990 [archaeon]|nr:hypothetical protein [archaeon]